MEIVLLIIVLILLFVINTSVNSKYWKLEDRHKEIQRKLYDLEKKLDTFEPQTEESFYEKYKRTEKEEPFEEEITFEEPEPVVETETFEEPELTAKEVPEEEPVPAFQETARTYTVEPVKESFHSYEAPPKKGVKKSLYERFKEKNPDLEKFIGENLINKIGILILVLGVSFFVKYAISKEWINEPARVGIGILTGALVMFVAHRLRRNYKAFSSVLVAGAISIFYFTIYIAFQEYQLFSQSVAFAIMIGITAFSVLVSVSYDQQELAILSLIGGFAAPFLVSSGEGNYIVLYSYIAILDIGILTISYFRKWKIVTILSFVFTALLFGTWVGFSIADSDLPHLNSLLFATLFYFIFSITLVLSNLRNRGVFSVIEYSILIVNTFFFFGIGLSILRDWESDFTGLFTLLLAVYNVLYAVILYKKFKLEKNAVFVLIGLALTFVTLTIPIQFEGNQITLFWAAESVLLFWLYQRSQINSFQQGSIVVVVLALISLQMDWVRYNSSEEFSIVFNPLFLAGIVMSITLYLLFSLSKKETEISLKLFTIPIEIFRAIIIVLAILTTYFAGFFETRYQADQYFANSASVVSFPVAYHFVFLAVLFFIGIRIKKDVVTRTLLVIGALTALAYIVEFYRLPSVELIENYSFGKDTQFAFYFHYIITACLGYFLFEMYRNTKDVFQLQPFQYKSFVWLLVFTVVYAASNEVMVHNLYFFHELDSAELSKAYPDESNIYSRISFVKYEINKVKSQIIKIGYPILWGVLSFVFLIVGIRRQLKNLRIIALSLLGLTIVKLFIYDIQNVSETGKIIAFILLGILILIISFVYQRIKKLVVDETSKNTDENESEN